MKTPITLWYRRLKRGKRTYSSYNHYEKGHVKTDKPKPKFPEQRGWLKDEWKKEYAYMEDYKIVTGGDV